MAKCRSVSGGPGYGRHGAEEVGSLERRESFRVCQEESEHEAPPFGSGEM